MGVSYSGLETARQDVLFPELDREIVRPAPADTDYETGVSDDVTPPVPTPTVTVEEETDNQWHATQDVFHPDYGHGWIQGAGHRHRSGAAFCPGGLVLAGQPVLPIQ